MRLSRVRIRLLGQGKVGSDAHCGGEVYIAKHRPLSRQIAELRRRATCGRRDVIYSRGHKEVREGRDPEKVVSSVSHSARRTLAYPTPAPLASQLKSSGTKARAVPCPSHDTPLPGRGKLQNLMVSSVRCAFVQSFIEHHCYFLS